MSKIDVELGREVSAKDKPLVNMAREFMRRVGSIFEVRELPPELDHETLYWEVWPVVKQKGYYPEITLGILKEYEALHGKEYTNKEMAEYIDRRTEELVKNPEEWHAMFAANDRTEQGRKAAAEKAWVKNCVVYPDFHKRG